MTRAGVVGVGMGDDGALHRADGVDVEPAGLAVEAVGERFEPGFRVRHAGNMVAGSLFDEALAV